MSISAVIQFKNCRLLRDHKIVQDDLWVRRGIIVDPEKIFFDEKKRADIQIDCKNVIIAPGFIDLQINGGYGIDFSSDDDIELGVSKVAKALLAHGVTSFCPTIVTSPDSSYHKILPKIPKEQRVKDAATVLGVHLEGPFINISKKGAHPINYIKDLENGMKTVLDTYGSLENVSILTMAPEKTNAIEVIKELVQNGITVSVGHSMSDLCDGEMAVNCGASLITHLFNAMLPFHHRDPGLVGLLTSNKIPKGKTVYFGIISDGVHTHPAALRIAHRTHPQGLILVTDAIAAMGLEEGFHNIGQLNLEVKGGKAYIAGTEILCGSIAPMDECIRIFQKATGCGEVYALETASLHPAMCLGIEKSKGSLKYEADADFVFLGDDFEVLSTWIAGECVYQSTHKNARSFSYLKKENNQS